jgi:acyl carrier protein
MMKPLETEQFNVSTIPLSHKDEIDHPSRTIPREQTKLEKAPDEFWQSIKTVIGLQNQAPPLQPISRNTDLPLSFSQERLWFLNQLKPDSSSHNIPLALGITGSLDVPALEQSLNEILQRHETLRTTFTTVDGQPVQVIHPMDFKLPIVDFTTIQNPKSIDEGARSAVQNFLLEEAKRPFDLNQGPLLRATLLQLDEQEYVLLVTIHQIVFDGWSEGVLFRELAALYEAFSTGKPSPLPELPIQYADFAVWQREWLQGEFLDTLLSYWKQQLGDGLPAQHLPTDRSQPIVPTRRSAHQTLVLPKELAEALKALSRQEGATLFTTLLTAFKILLHRYTNQDDLFVCTPTANRNRNQTKGLIGYFVNLLVLRTDLSGNPSFRELLSRVRQVASGAYAHQDLPVLQLVNSLNLVQTPLSQVMFVLQNVPKQPLKLPGLTVNSLDIENGTADFDMSLSMVEAAQELTGVLKYNTDLFDDATITGMLDDFQTLLEEIVANPEQPLSSLLPLVVSRSLPSAPDQEHREVEREFVAPRNPLEVQLTEIWQELLGIESIGIKDNFFELGGHSLLAVRLFDRIEKTFNKNIPSATIFQLQPLSN